MLVVVLENSGYLDATLREQNNCRKIGPSSRRRSPKIEAGTTNDDEQESPTSELGLAGVSSLILSKRLRGS